MKRTAFFTLLCCAVAGVAWAQDSAPPEAPAPAPRWVVSAPETAPEAAPAKPAEPAAPQEKEPLEVRVQRLLDGFNQRHDRRLLEMYSYGKASDSEPNVKQFADPRRVEIEIKDEQDREQTSKALAQEYTDETHEVQSQEQSVQDFIAKRQKTLEGLNKPAETVDTQDLEVAAENLSREPGTEAEVQQIRRRLDAVQRSTKERGNEQTLAQQELASAQDELKRLGALEQSLNKDAKGYTSDAASARENQLRLADRLEFYVVNGQAEDVLDQGRKATAAVHHLAPSPEVQDTLQSLGPAKKADSKPAPASDCSTAPLTNDKGCTDKPAQQAKE